MESTSITCSDDELLRLMAAGDSQAFTSIYRKHHPRIYRFALLMSGSAALAEDVTQEVFMVLMRETQLYDPQRGTLSAYLYGIARNQVLRRQERDRWFVPLFAEVEEGETLPLIPLIAQDDPLRDCTQKELIEQVRKSVLALPARYREVVVLCDFQELSYAEAALALDCAVGTVSSRLHRGHALLLQRLRALGKLDPDAPNAFGLRCFT